MYSQRVNTNSAIIGLGEINGNTSDATLTFQIECRMADCLSYVEINDFEKIKKNKNIFDKLQDFWWFKVLKVYNFEVAHTFKKEINEDDYFLGESVDSKEQILIKCELINLKSIFVRKRIERKLQINVVSKSGKTIYTKVFILNKNILLEKKEVRLGVEPS